MIISKKMLILMKYSNTTVPFFGVQTVENAIIGMSRGEFH